MNDYNMKLKSNNSTIEIYADIELDEAFLRRMSEMEIPKLEYLKERESKYGQFFLLTFVQLTRKTVSFYPKILTYYNLQCYNKQNSYYKY